MSEEKTEASIQTHPQAALALQHLEQINSVLSDQVQRMSSVSFQGADEETTVKVTVDGSSWLTGLDIEDGLLRLGAATVEERINEALEVAHTAAIQSIEEQHALLEESLTGITQSLIAGLRLDNTTG